MTTLTTQFTLFNKLPPYYEQLLDEYYIPLARWIAQQHRERGVTVVGINGAQGTGKTTLANFLALHLAAEFGLKIAAFSIDDLYLTKEERKMLARHVHPLLVTRGVPGTHDVELGIEIINNLKTLGPGEHYRLPVFNKAHDDRARRDQWVDIEGPIDLILFEGWCVGSFPDSELLLDEPINELEEKADSRGVWRQFVNKNLSEQYQNLFDLLDLLVFLEAPSFDVIFDWRLKQEQVLAEKTMNDKDADIMGPGELAHFLQLFQRITEMNLKILPAVADVVIKLNRDHGIDDMIFQCHRFDSQT